MYKHAMDNASLLKIWQIQTGTSSYDLAAKLHVTPATVYRTRSGKAPGAILAGAIEQITAGAVKASDWQ